jgi:uncharacterized pyridoxal phosphate-containing UPF0001 family protein
LRWLRSEVASTALVLFTIFHSLGEEVKKVEIRKQSNEQLAEKFIEVETSTDGSKIGTQYARTTKGLQSDPLE